jgi:DNA-binding NtrC family response regulator
MMNSMTAKDSNDRIKILAVDACEETLEFLKVHLTDAGYEVWTASGVEDAFGILEFKTIDLVITAMIMPQFNGFDLLHYVQEHFSNIEIMMITISTCIESAVRAMKEGAAEYLCKPLSRDVLLAAVQRMKEKLIRRRTIHADINLIESYGIIGESDGIKKVFSLIGKASAIHANVLISGESGTGKELVARAIHYNSGRASAPFVSVNCPAIPDTLLESELFGHVKGAFTGARDSREGYFQIANGGTIFLDEIGDASHDMQAKLLRVLQNKEIHVVGSSRVQKVDTRIVAATHRDLRTLVQKGHFREDLYYRLNVIEIPIPSLRERGGDIFRLLNYYVHKFSKELNRPVPDFTDRSLGAMTAYNWPGNVRELENLIQRLLVMIDSDMIDVVDLPEFMRVGINPAKGTARSLAEVEAEHIQHVLASVGGNKSRASEILGIDRKTLRIKLKDLEKN